MRQIFKGGARISEQQQQQQLGRTQNVQVLKCFLLLEVEKNGFGDPLQGVSLTDSSPFSMNDEIKVAEVNKYCSITIEFLYSLYCLFHALPTLKEHKQAGGSNFKRKIRGDQDYLLGTVRYFDRRRDNCICSRKEKIHI